MKTSFYLVLVMTLADSSWAARPDIPPTDENARACQIALGIDARAQITVDVWSERARFANADPVEIVFFDQPDGSRRVLRLAKTRYGFMRSATQHGGGFYLKDLDIETLHLTPAQYEERSRSRDVIGTMKAVIGMASHHVPAYQGSNALIPGDVFRSDSEHYLVFSAQGSHRTDIDEGDIATSNYLVLPLGPNVGPGLVVPLGQLVEYRIEEHSYQPKPEPITLIGHAEFYGHVEMRDGAWLGGTISGLERRPPEPTELVQILVKDFQETVRPGPRRLKHLRLTLPKDAT